MRTLSKVLYLGRGRNGRGRIIIEDLLEKEKEK